MLKKIIVLIVLSFIVSCGSHKSRVQTSKKQTSTRSRTQTASRKKNATSTTPKKPVASAPKKTSTPRKTETLESTSRTVVYAELVREYVNDYKEIAKDNMRRHGVPASITLAQGILESGAGRGTLCINANNHFGIKCHTGWTGESVYHDDDAEQECFRKYPKAAESYNDHSLFLTTRGRYAALFKLPKNDYVAWANGLKTAGYATDPRYPEKLIGLIERYGLAEYDAEVIGSSYKPIPRASDAPRMDQQEASSAPVAMGSHRVEKGDTLYSISKKHNLTVEQLRELNGLPDNSISIGQVLKVK